MKAISALIIALALALTSCATTMPDNQEVIVETPEPQTSTETAIETAHEDIPTSSQPDSSETSQQEKPTTQDIIEPGTVGPAGGVVFDFNGTYLEEFVIDTEGMNYEEALTISQNCTIITKDESYTDWRLPTVDELLTIHSQLFETGLVEFEETYYWAEASRELDTAPVVYFGTGFETEFYKDMDFVGLIVVRDV